ncbi:MAG TPA: hypothetical protein VMU82_00415, partial [Acetobacteraceae bacterium]|nr:hypothetical protein [Acetobacteraceae bacterium]
MAGALGGRHKTSRAPFLMLTPSDAGSLALEAWERGRAAVEAGDVAAARRWLARARRLAPGDAQIAVTL